MTKEEILAKSREENQKRDEMERETFRKAGQTACAVGGFVCMLIIAFDLIFSAQWNSAVWAVYLSISGTMLLTKYLRRKKLHELVFAVLQLALAALFLALYVARLAGCAV